MTLDPYPDLTGADLLDAAVGTSTAGAAPEERPELSPDDSRLLDALSQPAVPVVTAVEDQLRPVRAAPAAVSSGPQPLAPVFREPTG